MPSLKMNRGTGGYVTGGTRGEGPYKVVFHPGSSRRDEWRRAVQSVQPRIVTVHTDAFEQAGSEVFGA